MKAKIFVKDFNDSHIYISEPYTLKEAYGVENLKPGADIDTKYCCVLYPMENTIEFHRFEDGYVLRGEGFETKYSEHIFKDVISQIGSFKNVIYVEREELI